MGKIHHQSLTEEWFQAIKAGTKTVEGRLKKKDEKSWIARLEVGDIIIFEQKDSADTLCVKVTKLETYPSFVEMFNKVGLSNVLPGKSNNEEGLRVYRQWYSEEDEEELGVIAIFIELGIQSKRRKSRQEDVLPPLENLNI